MRSAGITTGILLCISLLSPILFLESNPTLENPDLILQKAQRAFETQHLDEALEHYDQISTQVADPGLVAINRGVIYVKQERYSLAERCFRQALDGSEGQSERSARAFYNLGICLLKQSDDKDVKRLKAAVECFTSALEAGIGDDDFKSDAEYNLQIAQLLYQQAKAKAPPVPEPPEKNSDPKIDPPPPEREPMPMKTENSSNGSETGDRSPTAGQGNAQPSDCKPLPGAGSLPVLMDTSEPQPLNPEETRDLLKSAEKRLKGERQRVREGATKADRPRPNNW
jgi:tetratricopeptide (TPR) repeat protein